jgi:hypothetical protein
MSHMSSSDERTYWFPAKRYGWGWGPPSTWQGWVALLIYLFLVIIGIPLIQAALGSVIYGIYALALTALLIGVCWLKGEPPRWRSGERDA